MSHKSVDFSPYFGAVRHTVHVVSTAQPGALDPTLKSVERLAAANGFDSWIMFNVYPQRATDPNDMDKTPDRALCHENLRWLKAVLAETEPTMWAAWGTLIEKRDYLPSLMREMVALTRERDIPWVTFGKRSKKGHPHHPLYLRKMVSWCSPPEKIKNRCRDSSLHQRVPGWNPCAGTAGGGGGPFCCACQT